jgi:hypothetical protein
MISSDTRRGSSFTIARNGSGPISHIPAHESIATVAPFRAWRSLQSIIAGGPIEPPL